MRGVLRGAGKPEGLTAYEDHCAPGILPRLGVAYAGCIARAMSFIFDALRIAKLKVVFLYEENVNLFGG